MFDVRDQGVGFARNARMQLNCGMNRFAPFFVRHTKYCAFVNGGVL
jgi:hypothetical protein